MHRINIRSNIRNLLYIANKVRRRYPIHVRFKSSRASSCFVVNSPSLQRSVTATSKQELTTTRFIGLQPGQAIYAGRMLKGNKWATKFRYTRKFLKCDVWKVEGHEKNKSWKISLKERSNISIWENVKVVRQLSSKVNGIYEVIEQKFIKIKLTEKHWFMFLSKEG